MYSRPMPILNPILGCRRYTHSIINRSQNVSPPPPINPNRVYIGLYTNFRLRVLQYVVVIQPIDILIAYGVINLVATN